MGVEKKGVAEEREMFSATIVIERTRHVESSVSCSRREQETWLSQKHLEFEVAVKARGRFGAQDRQAGRSEGRWQDRREKRRESERGERR